MKFSRRTSFYLKTSASRILTTCLIFTTFLSRNNFSKENLKNKLKTDSSTNDLIYESSPYLLQHAHNPIHWKAWTEKTLALAKTEKKLIILSIGYAACHWCHVMEHESFEDSEVAEVMNKAFVSIKVDREERPDVDQTYINAVQLMTGSGGWPLNVIALPDGRPVWGGTYFKKQDWINALKQIQQLYKDEPQKLVAYANRLESGLKQMNLVALNTEELDFKQFPTNKVVANWAKKFDNILGGYKGAPKFIMPDNFQYLLRHADITENHPLLEYLNLSLKKIAFGGIYDHIGGGFARYSVDEKWHIPHFEKMLYDNAQLVSLYCQAYQITGENLYKETAIETLEFIKREMTNKEGGFYSSLDADSKNEKGILEEGAFYVFTKKELQNLLAEDFQLFSEYYNINSYGKWENEHYVLIRQKSDIDIRKEFHLSEKDFLEKKEHWKNILLVYRQKRDNPRLDDKALTSWNALMLKAYVDGYKILECEDYLESALKNANFIVEFQLKPDGSLYRSFKDGKSSINAFLEDYAFTIDAFIGLYQVTLDNKWLNLSNELLDYSLQNFFDSEKHMFYFTSKQDAALITRNIEYQDNVIPSSNAVMAQNLFLLSKYFTTTDYEKIAHQMLKNVSLEMTQHPSSFSHWLDLMANFQNDFYEIVVVGPEALEKTKELNKYYIPNKITAGSTLAREEDLLFANRYSHGKTLIYVCVNNACQLPTENINAVIKIVTKTKRN